MAGGVGFIGFAGYERGGRRKCHGKKPSVTGLPTRRTSCWQAVEHSTRDLDPVSIKRFYHWLARQPGYQSPL